MECVSLPVVISVAGLVSTIMSIVAFWLGRKKAYSDEGRDKGHIQSDITYLRESITALTKSFEGLALKLDIQDEKREKDYREMLVTLTELKTSYKSLHKRVDELCKKVEE